MQRKLCCLWPCLLLKHGTVELKSSQNIIGEIIMDSELSPENQQWNHLVDHHIRPWHGLWMRIKPDGTVFAKCKSLRHFTFDGDSNHIRLRNTYYGELGEEDESQEKSVKEWKFARKDCLTSDGILHPAFEHLWFKGFKSGNIFGTGNFRGVEAPWGLEVIFIHPNLRSIRVSVGAFYADSKLSGFLFVREDSGGLPSLYWKHDTNLPSPFQASDVTFRGKPLTQWKMSSRRVVDKTLKVSEKSSSEVEPIKADENYNFFHLNEECGLYIPFRISKGEAIFAAGFVCFDENIFSLCFHLDDEGKFTYGEEHVYQEN